LLGFECAVVLAASLASASPLVKSWETGGRAETLKRFEDHQFGKTPIRRPMEKLVYRYPDRLDQMHDDNLAEIESQTVTPPRVFGAGELKAFEVFIGE